jgi:phosphoglycerate dehydrogenase-like enzyme
MDNIRVVLHPVHPPGVGDILAGMPEIELLRPTDNASVADALNDGCQILVTHTWADTFLSPSLRWIAGTGAGYEQYPLEHFGQREIVLTTAAGVHAACVAEHAFGLLLACTRRLAESVQYMTQSQWHPLTGDEIGGKNLLIVGMGRIGEEVARRAQGWDLSVIGIKRSPATYSGCLTDVRGPGELKPLCEWADIILLTAPATSQTRNVIGATELALLGDGWLINVGRGSLVDQEALVTALTTGQIRGAGLDVTAREPLEPGSPLWQLPNVVLSAHNAGNSPNYGTRWGSLFRSNLEAFVGTAQWRNRVMS